ncbi:hypothetical protein L3073_10720 [Ancylomarina sp. DW003]|nr:hypothetical protein [Ancylomarina sp. DW003]MDE5422680.1 hypothetical protein [Ancylomarina sp. DW003]
MGRNVKITLINNTDYNWELSSKDVKHGKFQKNKEPLKTIPGGSQMTFEVSNKVGAKIGPKGSVTYIMQDSNEAKIVTTWNHPFSSATSKYACYSVTEGLISSSMSPHNPTGHDQSITFNVKQNVLADS